MANYRTSCGGSQTLENVEDSVLNSLRDRDWTVVEKLAMGKCTVPFDAALNVGNVEHSELNSLRDMDWTVVEKLAMGKCPVPIDAALNVGNVEHSVLKHIV